MEDFPEDSADFAETERRFVREVVGVDDFEWVAFDHPSPRNRLAVPLSEATVTLVSTAGAHLPDDRPLSAGGHAALLPAVADVQLSHVGYDTDRAMEDLDVVYPVRTLQRLADDGFIGALAPTVISTMGFVPDGRRLLERAVPAAVERIHDEQAHLALLVPA
jgi:D-proline reductase (dithiol) PrdB